MTGKRRAEAGAGSDALRAVLLGGFSVRVGNWPEGKQLSPCWPLLPKLALWPPSSSIWEGPQREKWVA